MPVVDEQVDEKFGNNDHPVTPEAKEELKLEATVSSTSSRKTRFVMQLNCFNRTEDALLLVASSQEYRFSRPVTHQSMNGKVCFVKLVPVTDQEEDEDEDYEDEEDSDESESDKKTTQGEDASNNNWKRNPVIKGLLSEEDDEDYFDDEQDGSWKTHHNPTSKMSSSNPSSNWNRKGRSYEHDNNMLRKRRQTQGSSNTSLTLDFQDDSSSAPPVMMSDDPHFSSSIPIMPSASSPHRRRTRVKLSRALELVEAFGLQTCVARSICELSCNHEAYGKTGRSLYQLMNRLNSHDIIPGVDEEKASFYREAVDSGQVIRDNQDDCKEECTDRYTPCSRPTVFMLKMASNIDFSFWR